VERHFGECTVCYDFIAKDAFANFCFKEFRIDADSLQVRIPRTFRAIVRRKGGCNLMKHLFVFQTFCGGLFRLLDI